MLHVVCCMYVCMYACIFFHIFGLCYTLPHTHAHSADAGDDVAEMLADMKQSKTTKPFEFFTDLASSTQSASEKRKVKVWCSLRHSSFAYLAVSVTRHPQKNRPGQFARQQYVHHCVYVCGSLRSHTLYCRMAERMFGKEARHIKDPKVNAALRKV